MEQIIKKLRDARSTTELLLLRNEIDKKVRDLGELEDKLDERECQIGDDELSQASLIEYRSQSYAHFYNTTLEKDKSILTISVAGIGFLITFINLSKLDNLAYLFLFSSSICFLFCIYTVVKIFEKNADYMISVVTDDDDFAEKEIYLRKLDKRTINSFYFGILFAFILGIYTAMSNNTEQVKMSEKTTSQTNQQTQTTEKVKSAAGASAMRPSNNNSNQTNNKKG